jgi:hypothetical protein
MADVFISYRREDKARAEAMAKALTEEGLEVWWDATGLQAGETFDEKIQSLLKSAKAVLVLWSPAAVESEWVRGEGTIGRERGVLVPVMVRSCAIPVPFNLIQTPDLTGWTGDRSDPAYQGVVARLKELAQKQNVKPLRAAPNRAQRRLWQAMAALAVVAVAGASLWFFRPWEAIIAANDPVAQAQKARTAAFKRIEAFGVSETDINTFDWKAIASKRFKPDTHAALVAAADGGDSLAQALLCSVAYWGAPPVESDEQVAWDNCRRSAEAGDPVGEVWFGYLHRDRGEEEAATEWMKKAADQGFAWGELEYGLRLENGVGVASDLVKAVELYRAAQAKGLPFADLALGLAYRSGTGLERDAAEGHRLIEQAANKGVPFAMFEAAENYREGYGVAKDTEAASRWYSAAASQTDNERLASRAQSSQKWMEEEIAEQAKAAEAAATEAATATQTETAQ